MKIRYQFSLGPALLVIAYIAFTIVISIKINYLLEISKVNQLLERQHAAFNTVGRGLSEVVITEGSYDSIKIITSAIDTIDEIHTEVHEFPLWNTVDEVDLMDSVMWQTLIVEIEPFLRLNGSHMDAETLQRQGRLFFLIDTMSTVLENFILNFNVLVDKVTNELYRYIVGGVALTLLTFASIFTWLNKTVVVPLRWLRELSSKSLNERGELEQERLIHASSRLSNTLAARNVFSATGEIRDLADAYLLFANSTLQYLERIKNSERALKEYSEGLEQTVQQRTEEIRNYNERLQQEIEYHKEVEKKLEQAAKEVHLSSQAKSRFVANVSHEIRTPLNGIIGMLTLLDDHDMSAEQREYVMTAKRSADSLLALINDVLDFSRIESKKIQIELAEFSVRDLVAEVLQTFAPAAKQKNIELRDSICTSIPAVVKGHPVQLRQILNNLIGNALKFTESGRVDVTAKCVGHDEKYHTIDFFVSDTGVGIAADAMKNLFKPFTQADASITRKFGGTGLGLALVKQIVEMMNGSINVESELGRGTKIQVRLTVEKSENEELSRKTPFKLDTKRFRGKRILLVEDNYVNQMVASAYLKKFGLIVSVAENGRIALDKMTTNTFDIVLMDCHMPEMDGYEATQRIRRSGTQSDVPIIAMTADAIDDAKQRCLDAGMNDYLSKPFQLEQLQEILTRWMCDQDNNLCIRQRG